MEDSKKSSDPQQSSKEQKSPTKPPFDFYGITPQFYLNGNDKTVSWIGCVATVILGCLMLAVAIHYFLIFVKKEDSTIFTQIDSVLKYPFVDLKEKGVIYVIKTSYPTTGPFYSQRNKFFTVEAEAESMSPEILYPGAFPYEPRRTRLPMVPCTQLTVDLKDVNFSPKDLEDALCVQFTSPVSFGGNHKDALVKFISFFVRPCQKTSPADTVTCNLITQDALGNIVNVDLDPNPNPLNPFDVAVLTAAGTATAYYQAFFQDFSVSFGQIDDSPGLEDFDLPLIRNLVFRDNIKLDAGFVREYRFILSELEVETQSGWFTKESEMVRGLRRENENFNLRGREFFDIKPGSYEVNGALQPPVTIKVEMLFIQLQISNKIQKVQRNYTTFFDYLGNLGGVYEIMITVFTILVQIHSGIEMHLYLLNRIALQDNYSEEEEESGSKNQVADLTIASKIQKPNRYRYSEMICLKYFSCCSKDSKRYKEFESHTKLAKRRLDLKNLIINQAKAGTLAGVLMKPYQTKIASRLGEQKDEHKKEEQLQQQELGLDEAVKKLAANTGEPTNPTSLKSKIEQSLSEMVKGKDANSQKKGLTDKGKIQKEDTGLVLDKYGSDVDPKKSRVIKPPFDPFGLTPEFYIKGDTHTTSWVGCACTVIQILITLAVIIIYSISFFKKEEAKINVLNIKQKDVSYVDLKEKQMLIVFNHNAILMPPWSLFPISVFYVEKNMNTKAETRTQILTKNCADVSMDLSNLGTDFEVNSVVPFQECLEFLTPTPIGYDSNTKIKRYISAEYRPCLTNCYRHNFNFPTGHPFEVLGQNFEISPTNNLFDGGILYNSFMHNVLLYYVMASVNIDAATNLKSFEKPFIRSLGPAELVKLNLKNEVTVTMSFEHVVIRTQQGFLRKTETELREITYKKSEYKTKTRRPTDKMFTINYELTDELTLIERVYPNIIDLMSDLGGIVKILVFLCVATGVIHNQILFDKYLLETIFSAESNSGEAEDGSEKKQAVIGSYSYRDVLVLGYCCQRKSNPRKREFDERMDTVAARMDISNIVKRTEYVEFLSKVILQPYQTKILGQYSNQNDIAAMETLEIPLSEAHATLEKSIKNREGDGMSQAFDLFLSKQLNGARDESVSEDLKANRKKGTNKASVQESQVQMLEPQQDVWQVNEME